MLDTNLQHMTRSDGGLRDGELLEGADHVHIQGGRAAKAPTGEKDVSWTCL